jgi:hypothetical protein
MTTVWRYFSDNSTGINPPTSDPGLPVSQALPDVLHLQFFTGSTELIIGLETPNNDSPFSLSQKLSSIGEILYNPKGGDSCNECSYSFKEKYPGPSFDVGAFRIGPVSSGNKFTRFSTYALHIGDGSLEEIIKSHNFEDEEENARLIDLQKHQIRSLQRRRLLL